MKDSQMQGQYSIKIQRENKFIYPSNDQNGTNITYQIPAIVPKKRKIPAEFSKNKTYYFLNLKMATRNHERQEQKNTNPKKFTPNIQLPTLNLINRRHHMPKNVSHHLLRNPAQQVPNNLITGVEEQKEESPVTGGNPAQPVSLTLITRLQQQEKSTSRMRKMPLPLVSLNFPPVVQHPCARRSPKRAVLIGVSYKEWKFNLKGTVSDVKNMRELLINKFGYPKEYIRVLTEDEPNPEFHPTKANILSSLKWPVANNQPGDSLVFFYSGHGLQQYNFDNDEQDGYDEAIFPSEFWKEGMILDIELNSILVRTLNRGVKLHAIIDSCHSGTILDLPFIYDRKGKRWKNLKPSLCTYKGTLGGLAISFSACTDNQKESDTAGLTGKMNGSLTCILVHLLQTFPGPTYGDLFDLMEEVIEDVNNGGNFLKKMFSSNSKLSLTPLLSSSAEFNPYRTHILL